MSPVSSPVVSGEILCFGGELFFTTIGLILLHSCFYESKRETLGGNRFCYKQNVFCYIDTLCSKSGILGGNRFCYNKTFLLLSYIMVAKVGERCG
jgi:hypothetical protein